MIVWTIVALAAAYIIYNILDEFVFDYYEQMEGRVLTVVSTEAFDYMVVERLYNRETYKVFSDECSYKGCYITFFSHYGGFSKKYLESRVHK